MLDTNIWSSIGDEQVAARFDELMKSRNLHVVVPPSTLMEVAHLPVPEARQRIIRALGTGPRVRLCTEAEAECREDQITARRRHNA
jgi:predicted nucleic acid-binding protein